MAHSQDAFQVVILQERKVLYRGCFGDDPRSLTQAMSSNYEAGRSPHPADLRATVLHMAVSGFEDRARLATLARRRPQRIGTHIVTVELQPGLGVCVADTGGPGHWSIWGVPAHLVALVTDVAPA